SFWPKRGSHAAMATICFVRECRRASASVLWYFSEAPRDRDWIVSMNSTPRRLIVGITGASGAIYGVRLLRLLHQTDIETPLVISRSARIALSQELDINLAEVT